MEPLVKTSTRCSRVLTLFAVLAASMVRLQVASAQPELNVIESAAASTPALEQETGRSLFWQDLSGLGYRLEGSLFHDSVRPAWYSSVESVALFRHENDNAEFQTEVSGAQLGIGSHDFDSEFENRGQLVIGRALGDWYRVEGSWLGDFAWSDTHAAQSNTRFVSLGFDSDLRDGEINLRRRVRILDWPNYYGAMEFSTLVGFRYLNADEALNYVAQSNNNDQSGNVTVGNEMYGLQVGTLAQILFEDRGWLDFELKGGILANSTDVSAAYDDAFGVPQSFDGSEDRTSFAVDLSLMLNYQFTRSWTARVGYNFLLIEGVALGTRNLSPDATLPLLNVDHSGQAIYHGPSIGLVYAPLPIARREVCRP